MEKGEKTKSVSVHFGVLREEEKYLRMGVGGWGGWGCRYGPIYISVEGGMIYGPIYRPLKEIANTLTFPCRGRGRC
jgi:hypothetical protein